MTTLTIVELLLSLFMIVMRTAVCSSWWYPIVLKPEYMADDRDMHSA